MIEIKKTFNDVGLLMHREIKKTLTKKIELLVIVGVPLLFAFIAFVLGFIDFGSTGLGIGKSHQKWFSLFTTLMLYLIFFFSGYIGIQLYEEKDKGCYDQLMVAPIHRGTIMFTKVTYMSLVAMLQMLPFVIGLVSSKAINASEFFMIWFGSFMYAMVFVTWSYWIAMLLKTQKTFMNWIGLSMMPFFIIPFLAPLLANEKGSHFLLVMNPMFMYQNQIILSTDIYFLTEIDDFLRDAYFYNLFGTIKQTGQSTFGFLAASSFGISILIWSMWPKLIITSSNKK